MPKGYKAGGRSKGTPNKRTQEAIERVEWVLSLLEPTLEKDIKQLSPSERTRLWETLQEYVRPKLARTDMNLSTEPEGIQITFKPRESSD